MEDKALSEEIMVRLNLEPQSLGCVVAQIDFNEKRNCSLFHWQIFKSRYLALNFPDLLVSPVPQSYHEFQDILVVAPRDLIENGQVDKHLQEAKLTKKRWTLSTSSETIQTTLRYTLIARLTSKWNSLSCKAVSGANNGNLLLRGREFLIEATNHPVDAIQIRVFVADSIAWLGLRACRARLPRISLDDLQINAKDVENLFAHPNGIVTENRIYAPWVHVIPSLKRGRVTQVTTGFPVDCVFKSYDDLCKHWRRTYGVVLPAPDPSAIPVFASVSFLIGSRPFLYPMECLLRTFPQRLRHDKPEQVVLEFVESVRKCFQKDVVVEVAGRPVAEFVPAGQANPAEPSFPNVRSGPLNELLRRIPAPVVNTDETGTENVESVKAVPASNVQPGLHFMSRLSKLVRRPLSDLPSNVPSPATLQPKAPEKPRSLVPKGLFRMAKNDVAPSLDAQPATLQPKAPEKPHSLVPKGLFRMVKNDVAVKEPREKPRSLVPPKGIFRPTEKVAKKPTERKPRQKSSADLETLFKVGNLKKATVGQLQTWLRENGFECKGRAKKEDLLDRVSLELQKSQNEVAAAGNILIPNLQKFRKQPKESCPTSAS